MPKTNILTGFQPDPKATCFKSDYLGDQVCTVGSAEITSSKAGTVMIKVGLVPLGSNITVYTYFTEGKYFQQYLSRFLLAFPEITDYEDVRTWVGKAGVAHFEVNAEGYLRVKKYPVPDSAKQQLDCYSSMLAEMRDNKPDKEPPKATDTPSSQDRPAEADVPLPSQYGGFGGLDDAPCKAALNM